MADYLSKIAQQRALFNFAPVPDAPLAQNANGLALPQAMLVPGKDPNPEPYAAPVGKILGVQGVNTQQAPGALGLSLPPALRQPVPENTGATDTEMPTPAGNGGVPMIQGGGYGAAPHMGVTGRTTQKGFEIPAAAQANMDMGYDRQTQAVRDAAIQGQAKAVEQSEFTKAMADQQEQNAVEMKAREFDRDQKTEAAMAPMRALSDELASGKVDPSRYLQNQSTGAKLATMLSVIMGAGAAQRINGRNVGLDMMNDAVARDIDAQKASFEMKRGALAAKQSLYGTMMQNFGREDLAKEAAHIAIMKGYQARIAAVAAKYEGTEVANKATATLGQMQEQLGEREVKLFDAKRDHVVESESMMGGGGGAPGGGKKDSDLSELYVPEFGGFARTVKEAQDLRDRTAASRDIIDKLEKMKGLADQYGTGDKVASAIGYDTDAKDALVNAAADLVQPMVKSQGGGAAAQYEAEAQVKRIAGKLRLGKNQREAIDAQMKRTIESLSALEKASGIRKGEDAFAYDKHGNMVNVGRMTGQTSSNAPRQAPVAVQKVGK